jgi:hypothetical protein
LDSSGSECLKRCGEDLLALGYAQAEIGGRDKLLFTTELGDVVSLCLARLQFRAQFQAPSHADILYLINRVAKLPPTKAIDAGSGVDVED